MKAGSFKLVGLGAAKKSARDPAVISPEAGISDRGETS
jgi:hypothetical protein